MSLDLRLTIDTGGPEPAVVWDGWNMTHNVNPMYGITLGTSMGVLRDAPAASAGSGRGRRCAPEGFLGGVPMSRHVTIAVPAEVTARMLDTTALDGAATPAPWRAGGTILGDTGIYSTTGDEPEIATIYGEDDAALIVALRSAAKPLASWLRLAAADCFEDPTPHPEFVHQEAFAIARVILGEES